MFTAGCLRPFSLVFILSFLFGGIFEPACVAVYVAHYVEGYLKRGCALFYRNGRGRALFDRACEEFSSSSMALFCGACGFSKIICLLTPSAFVSIMS